MIFKAYTDLRQELKKNHAFGVVGTEALSRFKNALYSLFPKFNTGVSEEDEKTFVGDFLKEAYYSGSNAIRIGAHHNIDCQIHVDNDGSSPIGVIIENKYSKAKGNEMVKDGDLTHKAFYETILYYMREREAKNNSLRRIVITNMEEWFIFDALDYNRIFYKSPLLKLYRDYAAGRVSDASTAAFYAECEEFVKNSNITLRYAYFNFPNLAYTKDGKVREYVTDLYYLLSPYYLLKEDNDTKAVKMNSAFYNELLYIMGLGEVVEGNSKTKYIRRLSESKRKEGSLVENVISFIKSHGMVSKLTKFYGDKSEDDMIFSTALNLAITWVNRILFLKLLEGQLLYFHKNDKKYKFFDTDRNIADNEITYDDIDDLFFYVLNVPEDKREKIFSRKFSVVPYLNSSLFEPTDMEKEIMFVGNLNQNFPLPLYSSSILNGDIPQGVEYNSLQYLLHFLDKFDFGSGDKKTQNPDTLISASVLGYIFEKINGYQDGSFYTPEDITQYMCDNTIEKAVIARFKEHEHFSSCNTITDIYNKIDNDEEANKIFYSVKICDPAVGSGHFLVAALNKMLSLRRDLGLLKDEDGKLITKSVNIDVMTDDLRIQNCDDGTPFQYIEGNETCQKIQKTLFLEKKKIIENCLFGVDINPNAANICRLRLWIELLKCAYYNENGRLQTLPNIDINIKCGDSLIQKYPVKSGKSVLNNFKAEGELGRLVNQYADKVSEYKETSDKAVKALLKKDIQQIKSIISENAQLDLFEGKSSDGIYHNSLEWMLEFPEVWNDHKEFVGFDVVIGNPPYIFNRNLDEGVRKIYSRNVGKTDSYVYFIYLGIAITRVGGILSFITPNTYFTLSTHTDVRKELLKFGNLEFTYTGACFDNAYVDTMVFQLKNHADETGMVSYYDSLETSSCYECNKQLFKENIMYRFFVPNERNVAICSGIQTGISDTYERYTRIITRDSSIPSDVRRENIRTYSEELREGSLTLLGLISDGDQGLVTGNNSKYLGTICDDPARTDEIDKTFIEILNREGHLNVSLAEFRANKQLYYDKAEELKSQKGKPAMFGKFFLYKTVTSADIHKYEDLDAEAQKHGADVDCWVIYNRGNSEGLRWNVPAAEVLNWRKEYVHELKTSTNTNSRWQGESYYPTTGFGWVDFFTDRLKAFGVSKGPYSKNVIKMHSFCPLVSDKYILAVLNSEFMASYVKNMITITHTLQINDGRLIPIIVPTAEQHSEIVSLVDKILEGDNEEELMNEINEKVEALYCPLVQKSTED